MLESLATNDEFGKVFQLGCHVCNKLMVVHCCDLNVKGLPVEGDSLRCPECDVLLLLGEHWTDEMAFHLAEATPLRSP